MRRKTRSFNARRRSGLSLLEVSIGSVMAASIAVMAASVTVDMSRGMADSVARSRIAGEARLAIESFRRDFSGSDPDSPAGDRSRWRLVDLMVPSADELRLCFDASRNATADWVSPDRVVIYIESDGQLLRSDLLRSKTNVIAHHVESVEFEVIGNELRIEIEFDFAGVSESYTFNTPNL